MNIWSHFKIVWISNALLPPPKSCAKSLAPFLELSPHTVLVPSLELKHLVCSSHFLHALESLHPIVLSFRPLFNFSPLSPVFAPGRFAGPLLAQTFLHLALFHTRAIELPGLGCSLYFVSSPGLPQNRDQMVQFSCFFVNIVSVALDFTWPWNWVTWGSGVPVMAGWRRPARLLGTSTGQLRGMWWWCVMWYGTVWCGSRVWCGLVLGLGTPWFSYGSAKYA